MQFQLAYLLSTNQSRISSRAISMALQSASTAQSIKKRPVLICPAQVGLNVRQQAAGHNLLGSYIDFNGHCDNKHARAHWHCL
jgi:hypothetical protein